MIIKIELCAMQYLERGWVEWESSRDLGIPHFGAEGHVDI